MRLGEALAIVVIALVALALIINPVFNGFIESLIRNATAYLSFNTTSVVNEVQNITQSPCFTWGSIGLSLSSGESIFLGIPNGSMVYLLNSTQFSSWGGGPLAPTNYAWFESIPGIYVVSALNPGNYDLVACGNTGIVYRVLNYTAMGVAAYYGPHLSNITTSVILGIFNITNAVVENSTGASVPGFSLQLNAYVIIKYGSGESIHWIQNALVVMGGQYWFQGEMDVTNYVGSSQNLVYEGGRCMIGCFETPMSGALIIAVNSTGYGVMINYGYVLFRLGNETFKPTIHWYAHELIPIPNATVYIITSPSSGPYGWPMDTELVIGGPGNGGGVEFRELDAYLSLLYWNGTSWAPYPITYTFGVSTGEYAVNVYVLPISPATAELVTGHNDYQQLSG
ncbi:MAG: thermopsin family protease [Vulcanisaeta sp.]|uniref:thermopsin family protease n=1 Tax=Vulcanisaeta sp. TaxID=2020871 RepID=UPI003D0F4A86